MAELPKRPVGAEELREARRHLLALAVFLLRGLLFGAARGHLHIDYRRLHVRGDCFDGAVECGEGGNTVVVERGDRVGGVTRIRMEEDADRECY